MQVLGDRIIVDLARHLSFFFLEWADLPKVPGISSGITWPGVEVFRGDVDFAAEKRALRSWGWEDDEPLLFTVPDGRAWWHGVCGVYPPRAEFTGPTAG